MKSLRSVGAVMLTLALGVSLFSCQTDPEAGIYSVTVGQGDTKEPMATTVVFGEQTGETTVAGQETEETQPVTEPVTESTPVTQDTEPVTEEPSPQPTPDTGYEQIKCVEASGFSDIVFGKNNGKTTLKLTLSKDWQFVKRSENEYEIKRGGEAVGQMLWGTGADANWEILKTENKTKNGISYKIFIEKQTNESASYRYRAVFDFAEDGEQCAISLCVKYAELSAFSKNKLQSSVQLKTADGNGFGLVTNAKAKQSVLILGNSFISSSQVGTILQEMVRNSGKSMAVRAVSVGMANVSTFAGRTDILSDIRAGKYGALFMCGFYSASQADSLDVIKAACQASGTTLVIFPAHNESASAVDYATAQHPDALFLNWKGEVDTLIERGVDRWDLCVNDMHSHSTPLAGYVGAHMIYRAIYGTVPTGSVSTAISQSRVNSLLGDYAKTGTAHTVGDGTVLLFR